MLKKVVKDKEDDKQEIMTLKAIEMESDKLKRSDSKVVQISKKGDLPKHLA
jgi:hypothetical protein